VNRKRKIGGRTREHLKEFVLEEEAFETRVVPLPQNSKKHQNSKNSASPEPSKSPPSPPSLSSFKADGPRPCSKPSSRPSASSCSSAILGASCAGARAGEEGDDALIIVVPCVEVWVRRDSVCHCLWGRSFESSTRSVLVDREDVEVDAGVEPQCIPLRLNASSWGKVARSDATRWYSSCYETKKGRSARYFFLRRRENERKFLKTKERGGGVGRRNPKIRKSKKIRKRNVRVPVQKRNTNSKKT
jgi:hypothetical protein